MGINVLGICASPRRGATEYALKFGLEVIREKHDKIMTKQINLREISMNPCTHCDQCIKKEIGYCAVFNDDVDDVMKEWEEAHAYLIAAPVYSMGITPELAIFISRFRPMRKKQLYYKNVQLPKVGSAITVGGTRHGGQETAAEAINNFYLSRGILVSGGGGAYNGATIWSKDKLQNGTKQDEEGIETIRTVSLRLISAAKLIYDGFEIARKSDLSD